MRDAEILDRLPEADPTPWWREYADTDVPADPEDVPGWRRTCVTVEDKRKSPYYPEHDPPELPREAREVGVERSDLFPGDGGV